ncbi:alpha/beta hydrolase [Streptomyces albiflaviniger]|nr:alpha/beta hydrolase [Streptomyces albiflaviniger]
MATFVLVPGAWAGGWIWRSVSDRLRDAGHRVYTPTLTGLGERSHLGGPHIGPGTHVEDVAGVLTYEGLEDVVLVGHSYAAAVLPGVADRCRGRLRGLVYVDAAPLPSGMAPAELLPAGLRETFADSVARDGDGWALPVPDWDELTRTFGTVGISDAQRELMTLLHTPHPWSCYTRGVVLEHGNDPGLPQTLVCCAMPPQQREFFRGDHSPLAGDWTFRDLPTGHWPMLSDPGGLAALLSPAADG